MSSNEPRDQLAEFLGDSVPPIHMAASRALEKMYGEWGITPGLPTPAVAVHRMADFLAEEGWRPPPRRIETPEELDEVQSAQHLLDTNRCGHVAAAAIIRDANGDVYARDVDNLNDEITEGRPAGWWQIGTGRDDIDSSTVAFPVTVLWEPEEAR